MSLYFVYKTILLNSTTAAGRQLAITIFFVVFNFSLFCECVLRRYFVLDHREMDFFSLDKYDDIKTNIKFLKLIEKKECIWKHDSPDYTNSQVKVQAWNEIANAVNGTAERCSKRWRYIRQAYAEYVRSSFRVDARKSIYYLSPHVDFVRPYVKLHACFQSNESCSEKNNNESTQGLDRQNETTAKDFQNHKNKTPAQTDRILEKQFSELIEGTGEEDKNTKIDDVIALQVAKATSNSSSCSNLKRKMNIDGSEVKANHSKTTIPLKRSVVYKDGMFLESILPFVDEMSKKQIRRFRRKVMLLLEDVLENKNIDRPELVK